MNRDELLKELFNNIKENTTAQWEKINVIDQRVNQILTELALIRNRDEEREKNKSNKWQIYGIILSGIFSLLAALVALLK